MIALELLGIFLLAPFLLVIVFISVVSYAAAIAACLEIAREWWEDR